MKCLWIRILLEVRRLELFCLPPASAASTETPDISWTGDECHETLQQMQNERELMPILLRRFI